MAGLDFMAIARGRRAAEVQNQQDEDWAFQREQRDLKRQEQMWNRQAAAWNSTSAMNRQLAADNGVTGLDYLTQQRQQNMANPEFLALPPEVQSAVLNQQRQSALLEIQAMQQRGEVVDANKALAGWGASPANSGFELAILRGDPQGMLDAANAQFGSSLALNPDNTVTYLGQNLPAEQVVRAIAAARSPAGVIDTGSQFEEATRQAAQQQTMAQQVAAQQQAQEYNSALSSMLARGIPRAEAEATLAPFKPATMPAAGIGVPAPAGVPAVPAPSGILVNDGTVGAPVMPTAMQQVAAQQAALSAPQAAAVQAAGIATPGFAPPAVVAPPPAVGYAANEQRAAAAIPVQNALQTAAEQVLQLSRQLKADRFSAQNYEARGRVGVDPATRVRLGEARLQEALRVMAEAQARVNALPEIAQGVAPTNFNYGPQSNTGVMLQGVN